MVPSGTDIFIISIQQLDQDMKEVRYDLVRLYNIEPIIYACFPNGKFTYQVMSKKMLDERSLCIPFVYTNKFTKELSLAYLFLDCSVKLYAN